MTLMNASADNGKKKGFLSGIFNRNLVVRTGSGKHLFTFNAEKKTIEMKIRGEQYEIPLWQIEETLRTSQRTVMTVYQDYDKLPCGHDAGTVLNDQQQWVCTVCGR